MKIQIMGRIALEELARSPFDSKVAIISITDVNSSPVSLKNEPHKILKLSFEDIDNDLIVEELGYHPTQEHRNYIEQKYNMFSQEQSNQISEFYKNIKGRIDILICQCEHGQSRSAAVAAAILEFESKRGIAVFSNDRYYPNKIVFRRVLKSLKQNHV